MNEQGTTEFSDEKIEKIEFVQFHPSYDYTDFVEGLRPTPPDDNGNIGFELKNGVFKEFCKKAFDNPESPYVFIIDEINRGEISKIFGELFFSIDPGYRGKEGKVKTQYANIQSGETVFNDDLGQGWFFIPENVYIIGTMNDIDRSVESFDFAMRRRFTWKEITAKESQRMFENKDWKDEAIKRMDSLNNAISKIGGLNSSYHIGAAYFLKLENNDYQQLWNYHLKSLLFEYLRGMPDTETKLKELENAYKLTTVSNENKG
jgi:5-methylcytosine-specific restriction protein B